MTTFSVMESTNCTSNDPTIVDVWVCHEGDIVCEIVEANIYPNSGYKIGTGQYLSAKIKAQIIADTFNSKPTEELYDFKTELYGS